MEGGLLWVLLTGTSVVVIMLLVYNRKKYARIWPGMFIRRDPERTPLEDLQIRYLRGTIDWEDYEAQQRELSVDD